MSTTAPMTVEQFAQMQTPETEDYELVDGELIPLPSATPLHAKIRGLLERLVGNYFDHNPIGQIFGEIDCRLTELTLRRPDLAIVIDAPAFNWRVARAMRKRGIERF